MIKKGMVMEITPKNIGLLTPSGEFVYVKKTSTLVDIGEEYSGEVIELKSGKALLNHRYFLPLVASLMFILILSSSIFMYNQPVSAVTISINPSVKLFVNRWNKVVKILPLNSDGESILKDISLKNLTLEKAIEDIIVESKNKNFIKEEEGINPTVNIEVNPLSKDNIDLSAVEKVIIDKGLNYNISTEKYKGNSKDVKKEKDINKDNSSPVKNPSLDNKESKDNNSDNKNKENNSNTNNNNNSNNNNSKNSNNNNKNNNKDSNNNGESKNKEDIKDKEKDREKDRDKNNHNKNNSSEKNENKGNPNNNNNNNNKDKKDKK